MTYCYKYCLLCKITYKTKFGYLNAARALESGYLTVHDSQGSHVQ